MSVIENTPSAKAVGGNNSTPMPMLRGHRTRFIKRFHSSILRGGRKNRAPIRVFDRKTGSLIEEHPPGQRREQLKP